MFIGEVVCLMVFYCVYYYHKVAKKNTAQWFGSQKFSPLIFFLPACCDALATSLIYTGLNLTYASSYQMLHPIIIMFTSLLSVAFLGSILQTYHWLGMFIVIVGSVVVSMGDVIGVSGSNDVHSVLTGDLLIVIGQLINAIQMIVEERYVKGYNIPSLQAVGWEGVFGLFLIIILLIPMYFVPWHVPSGPDFWQDQTRFEDTIDAFYQIFYIPTLSFDFFAIIISIALFNLCGLSVTREVNVTTRVILDNVRIVFVLLIGLAFQWQKFNFYQPIGCALVIIGTFIYCNVVLAPCIQRLYICCTVKSNNKETSIEPLIQVIPRWRRSH